MRTLALGVLIWIVWLPGLSHALGLGSITVKSALNQPLHAEIALSVERTEDLEDLTFKLAPEALFRRLGIERPHYLTELRFQPQVRSDGQRVLQIQTPNPVREPFLNFLIEATWPGGRVVREYTVLLDPPKVFEPAPAASNLPVSVANTPRPAPAAAAPPAAPRPDTAAQTAQSYRVRAGDTMWQLGTRLRPDNEISVQQMMIALLRANPEAFIDNNINQVIQGRVLRVPPREEILALSQQEALQEVVRQNNLWRDYRTRLAQRPAPRPAATTPTALAASPPQTPTATPTERPRTPAQPAAPAEDRLEIRANDIPAEELEHLARTEQELAMVRETAEVRGLEIEGLQDRIRELEENLSRKDRLLTLTNEQMAELQQRVIELQSASETAERQEDTQQALSALTQEPPASPDETTRTPEPPVSDTLAGLESAATPPEAAQTTLPLLEAFTEPPAHSMLPDEHLTPGAPEQDWPPTILDEPFADEPAAPLAVEPLPPATPVTPPPAAEPAPTPAPVPATPSLWEELLADPRLPLAGVGLAGILVLLLLWSVIRSVLRRKQEDSDTLQDAPMSDMLSRPSLHKPSQAFSEDSETDTPPTATMAAAVPPKEQTVELPPEAVPDAQAHAETATDELQEASQAEKEIHTDDTIAEVDVYLAYGLFDQAEELLKNALNKHPERIDYHYKLVETYFATKNQDAFDAAAQNMHIALEGKPSALWKRVAEMAQELSPANPLFAVGEKTSSAGSSSVLAAGAAGAGLAGAAAAIGALDTKEFEFAPHELEETLSGVEFELDDEPTLGQDTIEQEIDLSAATPTEAAEDIAPPTAHDFESELSDLAAAFDAVDVADPLTDDSFTIELDDIATDLDDSPLETAPPSSETAPAVHDEHTLSPTAQEDDSLSIDLDDFGADLDDSPLETAPPISETAPAVHDEHTRPTSLEDDGLSIDLDDFGTDLDDSPLETAPPTRETAPAVHDEHTRPTSLEDDSLSIEQDPFAATLDDSPEEEKSAARDDVRDTPAEEPDPFSTSSLDDFAFDAESPADPPSSAPRLATDTGDIMDFSADELEGFELSDLEKELNQLDDAAPKGQDSTVELDADSEAFSIAFERDTQSSDSEDDFLSDLQLESTAHFERTDPQNDDLKADEFSDFADFTQTGEISTKIELARAYMEMGDPEGARATLEEVLADGNDAQKDQASALLKQLPG